MRPFFPRIRGGARDNSSIAEDLLDYHAQNPGVTEATLGALTTRDGHTGYDLLAHRVPGNARTVVDLGCGNGPLLRRLLAMPLERVIGIDVSRRDLELARVGDSRLELLETRAQSFELADVDAVLSHHAFYLMDPIEPVIANIARSLRPGGVFAWVTSSPNASSYATWSALLTRFGAITKREHPTFTGWGDRRVWSDEGLRSLFAPELFTPFAIEEFVLVAHEPAEALVDRLMRFLYSAELQSDDARAETRREWLAILAGVREVELPWAIVSMQRR